MLSFELALARLLAGAPALAERCFLPTLEAVGRVLAEAQPSALDAPPLDNSAMDGYA
ncbi:MAG TPA: molybdopterin molybdenumtransferase MoeA, partial [Candidatus Accumulibacter sp.]|nr:molybdopterin molybdenumtransferase MoeA [Accumulibacter sp.]